MSISRAKTLAIFNIDSKKPIQTVFESSFEALSNAEMTLHCEATLQFYHVTVGSTLLICLRCERKVFVQTSSTWLALFVVPAQWLGRFVKYPQKQHNTPFVTTKEQQFPHASFARYS